MGKLKLKLQGKHVLDPATLPKAGFDTHGIWRAYCGKRWATIPLLKRLLPKDAALIQKYQICAVCWANARKSNEEENDVEVESGT